MTNVSANDSSYDESIEGNEDLSSPNEVVGQQESGIPSQHIQANNTGTTQNANSNITNPFVFANYFAIYLVHNMLSPPLGFPLNHHIHRGLPLKRLNQTERRRNGQFRGGRQYSKLGKKILILD
ncbi:unnamed protein product [Adineta ricciae]|uniref:Uncharacterized protein n=1 Tax=Adineta ricciae TaxID=249248 RepID=A0A816FYL8_ADIRI|nr:unnamed protein product [Adineta ricciae]